MRKSILFFFACFYARPVSVSALGARHNGGQPFLTNVNKRQMGQTNNRGRTRLVDAFPTTHDESRMIERQTYQRHPRVLSVVVLISSLNILCNILRPDDAVNWVMRLPRIFWEICIGVVATFAHGSEGSVLLLLLSIMTGPTALVDIFLWGPVFAFNTSFESCEGGWFKGPRTCSTDYIKGMGRLLGMFQSIFGGLFYLLTAVICFTEYNKVQSDKQNHRHHTAASRVYYHSLNDTQSSQR